MLELLDFSLCFRGKIVSQPREASVLLMFSIYDNFEEYEKEARVYSTALRNVQGIAVPRFYGFYTAEEREDFRLGCIVLEDCGDPFGFPPETLTKEQKFVPYH